MDDLIAFCVEQIAFDGDQGTTLEHLWGFVREFLSTNQHVPSEIDQAFKRRLWRYLLGQEELILKEGDTLLFPSNVKTEETEQSAAIRNLDKVIANYKAEELRLFSSEETQWVNITGFPKYGNPVPNLHFKLLSAVSQARAAGISQAKVAKVTKQDPRSFHGRTKLLAELGLLTKTPVLENGNHTYKLTHTRFLPPQTSQTPRINPTIPSSTTDAAGPPTTNNEAQQVQEYRGFYRDQTIGAQITEVIGDGPWDKKTLFTTLMASSYETPIENYLEKATFPKPILLPRPPPTRVIEKVPRKSRAKPKPLPPPAPSDPALSTSTDPNAPPETTASIIPVAVSATSVEIPEVARVTPSKKRSAPKQKSKDDTPKEKKQKFTHPKPPPPILDQNTIDLLNKEREQCLLSMIHASQGVLLIDLKFDELYKSHVSQIFPSADSNVDYKTLAGTLDVLEQRGEIQRIMLSVSTITGRKLYKSVLTLPGVDLETNSRVRELRDELQREAMSYKPAPLENVNQTAWGEGEGPTLAVEVVKTVPKQQRDLAPIPTAVAPTIKPQKERKRKQPAKEKSKTKTPKESVIPILDDDDIPPEPEEDESPTKRRRVDFSPEEDTRLYQAVSLLKKYSPSRMISWTTLTPLLGTRRVSSIKRRYAYLEDTLRPTISRFLLIFETEYKKAADRGEVKPLEAGPRFDLVYCFNWFRRSGLQSLVDDTSFMVVESERQEEEREDLVNLPDSMEDLRKWFEVTELEDPRAVGGSWRADYWGKEVLSSVRRQDCLYSEAFMVPLNPPSPPAVDENSEFIESLVKATVLTPDEMHDKEKTKQVLETWGVQNVESAVRTLMDKKIISRVDDKNRTIPGRHYKMSEKWTNTLRPYTTGNLFGQGQAFREYLAEAFKNGKDILVSEMTNDGAVYCILNLLAAGKIVLKSNVKEFKMGSLTNTYRGRAFDKKKLEFGVIIAGTDKFDRNGRLAPSKKVPMRLPGEPLAWVSVNEEVLETPLNVLKCFVYSHIHLRPCIPEDEVIKLCAGILTSQECKAIIRSLEDDGLVKRTAPFSQTSGLLNII